ncbi:hypothetical protein O6H91_05G107900 [Diphasiastrum complanatum]|uniref:Uncharacterized protein n=1 Tax=Diphasiastrum complanatum TaxID=34168 RepID=A0ACC2DS90_DIPCM|nr:hypothetical protein O6H91_Y178400 [Diphasiastrum complanatum]KAJ7557003.1 hypothetical protein O6H91_05G107900 [Diphasiastrum complanatum]
MVGSLQLVGFQVMVVAMAMYCGYYIVSQQRQLHLPPGPWPWPVLGNLHQLGIKPPHQILYKLSRKHGELMYLRLGSVPTIVVSSASMVEQVLKVHDQVFASRPRMNGAKRLLVNDQSGIAFAPYGAYWRLLRRICTSKLFTTSRLQGYKNMRIQELKFMLQSIYKDSKGSVAGGGVKFDEKLATMGLNTISRMMLDKRIVGSISRENAELKALFDEGLQLLGSFDAGDFIPYISWLDPFGYQDRMKKVHRRLDSLLENIIHEHVQYRNEKTDREDSHDLLDVLLTLETDGVDQIHNLSKSSAKAVILDLLIGGSTTTSATLIWAMAELLHNPALLARAQHEIDTTIGNSRIVDESDIPQLKLIRAVVKETFRIHPVVPLLIPRESLESCEISGYTIPRATRVLVNVWAIGRDASVWKNPLEFNPDRFLQESSHINVQGQDFELIPFGSGRRKCVGMGLGLCVVEHTLACLLHCFDWDLPHGNEVDMQEDECAVVGMHKPPLLVPSPRGVTPLYMKPDVVHHNHDE